MRVSTSVSSALGSIATKILLFGVFIVSSFSIFAQVGIGTPTPSSKLEVVGAGTTSTTTALKVGNASSTILTVRNDGLVVISTTNQGFLPPRMTTAQRNAIATPEAGLTIFNTSSGCLNIYSGTSWRELCPSAVSGTITALNIGSVTNSGTLTSGSAASGVSSSVPYSGGNGEPHSGQTVTSTGVTGLTATLSAGTFAIGDGTLTYTITGTPASGGEASFALSIGGQTGTLTRTVNLPPASVTALNCASPTNTGSLASGSDAQGASSVVAYTGGNGGTYATQTVNSTGVTGLTATLSAGTIAVGAGTLTYTLSGTPTSSGTASFALSFGGQSCTLTRTVGPPPPSVYCSAGTASSTAPATTIVDVQAGLVFMDRNLGATRYATSHTDVDAYGDLYQWGRRSDGHQCRNSLTTSTLSSSNQPAHGDFIVGAADWRSQSNSNLWQSVNGVNNPCPSGYHVPTRSEWDATFNFTNTSPYSRLGATLAGKRLSTDGSIDQVGQYAGYWTSSISGNQSYIVYFTSSTVNSTGVITTAPSQLVNRAEGYSVRCWKN
jgi:hypothetical protein